MKELDDVAVSAVGVRMRKLSIHKGHTFAGAQIFLVS
jgi:hypothetical protein